MIKNWYIIPAFIYLLITLIAGIWIRIQWIQPEWVIFNTKYLIHAHSHLAMLGWLFPILSGLLITTAIRKSNHHQLIHPYFLLPLHISLIAMTIAFAFEGYSFNSIVLSTCYIGLMIWFALFFLRNIEPETGGLIKKYALASVWIMLLSNIGPLALAGGTFMGASWIKFWISYYLHLQFSGWVTFAVAGIIYSRLNKHSQNDTISKAGFVLLLAGLAPLLEPLLRSHSYLPISGWIGFAGGLLTLAGTIIILRDIIKYRVTHGHWISAILLWTGITAFFLKGLFQFISGIPGTIFAQVPLFAVGFTHLMLLAFATTCILWFITPAAFRKPSVTGTILFVAGTVTMTALLFWFGMHQYLKNPVYSPVQELLAGSGIAILSGYIILIKKILFHRDFNTV